MDLQLDHKYDREYARGLVVFPVRFEGGKTGGFQRPFSVFMRPCALAHPLFCAAL